MIRGHCKTNIDACAREEWPTRFAALPREGDLVQSARGRLLRVCSVVHTTRVENARPVPVVVIELGRLT